MAEIAPLEPGIYPDISNEDYHRDPAVSKTQLDLVDESPGLLEWSKTAPRSDSDAAHVGTALHTILLEPERFALDYAREFVPPDNALSTVSDMKAWLDARGVVYKKSAPKPELEQAVIDVDPDAPLLESLRSQWSATAGATVLTDAEWVKIHEMRDSVMAHPEARALLSHPDGVAEQTVVWRDPDTGLMCRCRPDWWVPSIRIVLDVKSCDDIRKFHWSVRDYRYDVQEAFYGDGIGHAAGEPQDAFLFLVVGKSREMGRYPVKVLELDRQSVLAARSDYKNNLHTVAECRRDGFWPGVESLTVPPRRHY